MAVQVEHCTCWRRRHGLTALDACEDTLNLKPEWQRRWSMVEYQRRALTRLMALHGASARISAARLLDRGQAHALEALAWALDARAPAAVHEYADIIWRCMPLLQPRLDASQRQALCEARAPRTPAALPQQHA